MIRIRRSTCSLATIGLLCPVLLDFRNTFEAFELSMDRLMRFVICPVCIPFVVVTFKYLLLRTVLDA